MVTASKRMPGAPDVLVLGEVLVELSSLEPLRDGASLRLGFSGDALNLAAASAAAGARTALLARVPRDQLGDALVSRVRELGVQDNGLVRTAGRHGLYLTHADPAGERHFVYAREGSAGSQLGVDDVDEHLVASAGIVVATGVTCAISETAAAAVLKAARGAQRFVYDPNFRPRLTTTEAASNVLQRLSPLAEVVTPSWPVEARQLLGLGAEATPNDAVEALLGNGARNAVLTCGPAGALVVTESGVTEVPGIPAARVVDQTGAGDCLTGTMAARIALGDDLVDAVRLGVAAASLSVQGQGGTGYIPSLAQSRALLARGSVSGLSEVRT